jgi:hypothetical protein
MRKRGDVYRVLVRKPKGNRPVGRANHRWENNLKADILEVVWGVWTGLGWLKIGTGGGQL